MLEMLEAIGLDKRQFGLHSLRAGGASAATNAGVGTDFSRDTVDGKMRMQTMGM